MDLSYSYDEHTLFWPTAQPFRLQKVAEGMTDNGYFYAANDFTTSEHGGTHIDAPVHFAQGRRTVDQIPLERSDRRRGARSMCPARPQPIPTIRCTEAISSNGRPAMGGFRAGAIVLLRTGFGRFWPDAVKYLGTADRGAEAVARLHFPGLHPDAARWLTTERSVHAVGLDTASIDFGQSTLFETHRVLMEKNVPALENLANLDRLPEIGFYLIALPIKIGGGSGGPLRAVAVLPSP